MGIRKYKPTSPGRRDASVSDFADLTKGAKPEKSLLRPLKKNAGRNNQGVIGVKSVVDSVQYDPNRSARIALLKYIDGDKRYIIAPDGLKQGMTVESGAEAPPTIGNCLPLKNIPLATVIHNVEMRPGQGGVLCRSAGSIAQFAWVKLVVVAGWAVARLFAERQ